MREAWAGLMSMGLAVLAGGCSTSPKPTGFWIADHGGVLTALDARQARIDAVSKPLITCCTGRRISVQVLATDVVTAYSLWNGHVFVTRGLTDHLDDAELQAAIAHELGHLLSDGHVRTVASLRGCCEDRDREVRADDVGTELLKTQGLSPNAMVSMLRKVEKYGSLPSACRIALEHRIAALSARIQSAAQN